VVAPCRRDDVREEDLDGETILFDPRHGNTCRLSPTARAIWRRCDGHATTQQIAAELLETYEAEPGTILDHVEQLLARLAELKLFDAPRDG